MTNDTDRTDPISRSEIAGVADAVEALRSGAISPDEFRRRRVVMGIYPIRGGPTGTSSVSAFRSDGFRPVICEPSRRRPTGSHPAEGSI